MDEYPTDFVTIGSVEDVYTTHVIHQEQFYVHIDTRSSILEEIMDKLESRYSLLGPNDKTLPQIKLGGLCAAKFTDDNNWYRAKITGRLNTGLIEVYFVDYGNTDYVGADRVKKLDPDLMQYPVQSYRCSLADVSCEHDLWPPELRVQFEDLVIDKQCKAVFTGKTEDDIYILDMYDEQERYINKLFGAAEKKITVRMEGDNKNRNGSSTGQGFDSVLWKEGQKIQVVVVYVTSPEVFWCQEVVHTNKMIILSEELSRLHMTQGMGLLRDIEPGSICAAKFQEDEAWYRGIIQSLSRNKAQVYFVDYGNTEDVEIESLCELKAEFRSLPALAVKCSLASLRTADGSKWSQESVEEFEKMVVDKEFEVSVVGRHHNGYEVSLLDIEENKDVGSQLKMILGQSGNKAQTPPKLLNCNNNNQYQSKSRGLDLPVGSAPNVFLSWIDNPSDFWVQLEQASDILDKLSSDLQEYYSQPRPMALSAPGAFVIARFSEDQQWYRGLVVKEFDDHVKVLFIDYGNADTIPKTELRQVNPQFGQIDPLAFRCCLKGVKPLPQDNSWSVDAKDFLEKLTENGCQCEVESKNDAYRFVNLKVNGKDITQELVSLAVVAGNQSTPIKSNSYSQSPKLQENQIEKVMVTHIDSPHSFWIQLSKNNSELDAVMEKLDSHYSEEGGTPIARPTAGQACVAQYSLDNAWYRAVILNVTSSGYNVLFVDYGNKEVVSPSQVCVVEPRFLDLPSQAIRCSLPLPGDVSNLTDALSNLVLEKDVDLKVLSAGGDFFTVDLIVNGQSVCNMLRNQGNNNGQGRYVGPAFKQAKSISQGSIVKAFTSMVHNPGRFFIQLSGVDEELSELMNQLTLHYVPQDIPVISQLSVGMYCVALYEEDKQWYRGRITSVHAGRCQVLFVDYGNEEFVENRLVKVLIPEVSNSPILAYECSLHGVQTDQWSESSIEYFESLVMDQELSCTFISPLTVTISCNGEDVAKKMISAGHCRSTGVEPKSPLSISTQNNFGTESRSPRGFGEEKFVGNGGDREEKRGFGGGRQSNTFGENGEKGFGGGRREGRGFGEEKSFGGGKRFGGNRGETESYRSDEGSDKGGFKPRSRDGDSGSFGNKRGGGSGSGFGGGRRDRNASAGSSSSSTAADKFTYADPPSESESAILVHIDDDGTFYLQLPSMEKDIVFLSKRLAGSYKSGGPRLKGTVSRGVICCCKFPDDGSMYRCQVEGVEGNKLYVRYMDYGNVAEHSTYDLKYLFPDLLQYPVQAFPCKLRGLDWCLDKAEKFGSATLDKDLEVTFTSTSVPYLVDIKTPDGDLLAIMTGQIAAPAPKLSSTNQAGGFGAKSPGGFGSRGGMETSTPKKTSLNLASSPAKPAVPKQVFIPQTAPTDSQTAFISHISEDGYFYLQLDKDTDLLESLTEKLTGLNSNMPHPGLSKGAACAAIFSEDNSWYRAVISEIDGDQFSVTFVDFGNGDKISKENICPLSEDLLSTSALAYQCSFSGEDEPLLEKSKEKLEEYLLEQQITVSFTSQSSPFAVTATLSDGQDLHEIVCPSNRFRSHVIPKDVTPVGVCHIEDDGRFFICFYKQYKSKEKLQKCLQEHYSSTDVESLQNLEADVPCCFKSSDEIWHRCRINSVTDSKAEVQYVDIGKIESVEITDLKMLPSNFLREPQFALECRLKGVESWTEDLKEKFIDMTDGKILNSTFYTMSPPYRVSLARSIELDLLGLSAPEPDSPRKKVDDSTISKANANRSTSFHGGDSFITEFTDKLFFVQLVSEEEQLQSLSDSLDALMATDQCEPDSIEVGTMLCAQFSEDDVWYRAVMEEMVDDKFTVRFVDYGNTDTLSKDRLSSLPEELSITSIPAFAYKCQLSTPSSQMDQFKAAVLDKMVVIEMISVEENGIFNVSVTLADGKPIVLDAEIVNSQEKDVELDGAKMGWSKRTTVTVPFVVSPSEFCIQLQAEESQLDTMMNELYDEITSLGEGEGLVPDDIAVGDLCTALYDESWYRVRVVSFGQENQSVEVLYVDHGNTEMVSDQSELRALPSKFKRLPLFGHKACLSGIKPVDDNWTEEAIEAFKALVEEKSMLADLIDCSNENQWLVQLLDMGTPVQDTLVAKGHGIPTESVAVSQSTKRIFSEASDSGLVEAEDVPIKNDQSWKKKIGCILDTVEELKQVKAFISHLDNPSQMWCQLASSTDDLEELTDKIESLYSSIQDSDKVVGDINIGDLVIGLFEEDGMRYRSVAIDSRNSDSDKLSLRFIDYGNSGFCLRDQILTVREELCNQPALSFRCCLDKIQPLKYEWSSEACNRLTELTTDQELFLTLVGRKQDGTALVDLILPEAGKSLSCVLIEEGLVKSLDVDTSIPVAKNEVGKGDVSECLEITQPIMESTAMVDEAVADYQDYSFGYADDGYYKCIELNLHSSYDIIVSDDELPNAFCVQLKELSCQLETLMKEIAEYVESCDDEYSPKIGDPCLVMYESSWYRGLIKMETIPGTYVVASVDCGWEVGVEADRIRSLPAQFLELPGQAIQCYLAGVVSLEPEWSSEAIVFFTDYIREYDLHINVLESADDGKYGVSMTTMQDSSTEYSPSSLNQMMVELGFSDIVPGSNIDVQYDMEKTLDTDMLNELEESFREVEKNMENKMREDGETDDVDSTHSGGPPSFHSAEDEEEVISGNIEENTAVTEKYVMEGGCNEAKEEDNKEATSDVEENGQINENQYESQCTNVESKEDGGELSKNYDSDSVEDDEKVEDKDAESKNDDDNKEGDQSKQMSSEEESDCTDHGVVTSSEERDKNSNSTNEKPAQEEDGDEEAISKEDVNESEA